MGIRGELDLTKCSKKVVINMAHDLSIIDIKIGDTLWIILTKEQANELKYKLEEVL